MSSLQKGLLLAALQVALVSTLGAKLLLERSRLPRVWAKTGAIDPDLPLRGRYVALQLEVALDAANENPLPAVSQKDRPPEYFSGALHVENGHLAATRSASGRGGLPLISRRSGDQTTVFLMEPVLFFLPEHAQDPVRKARGAELWAEVTVPKQGPPRPLRLAIKRGEIFTPLDLK